MGNEIDKKLYITLKKLFLKILNNGQNQVKVREFKTLFKDPTDQLGDRLVKKNLIKQTERIPKFLPTIDSFNLVVEYNVDPINFPFEMN
jgi:hypothetical protein